MTNPLLGTLSLVPVTSLYAALNAFLTLALSANVSRVRTQHKVFRGDGGHAGLSAAIRAHGNNIEQVPLALILLLLAELSGGNSTALHVFGGALLVARLGHAFGMLRASPIQAVGAVLTLVVQLGLAGWVLWLRPWG
ncbi:MAPEG family protein [Corallococcus sp. AS-1-6]|uniref:MAPEG family protein n=1 Tax=Corallococcus TaxID=83461 RepID=UPI001CBAB48B|nr:MAPEG family protein [Corallococcus sp. AS-1-6]MBZ4371609.1 MAPEG family protein [Corallococcus sp. AS-1-6]